MLLCPENPGPWESEGDGREGARGWSCLPAAGIIKMHGWDVRKAEVGGTMGVLRAPGSRKPTPGAEVEPGCSLQAGGGTDLPEIGRS